MLGVGPNCKGAEVIQISAFAVRTGSGTLKPGNEDLLC